MTCPQGHTLALLLVGSDSPPPLKGRGLDSTFWREHQRICDHFLQHPTALLEDPSDAHLLVPEHAQLIEHPTPWLHRPMSCGSAGPVLVTGSQPHALSLLLQVPSRWVTLSSPSPMSVRKSLAWCCSVCVRRGLSCGEQAALAITRPPHRSEQLSGHSPEAPLPSAIEGPGKHVWKPQPLLWELWGMKEEAATCLGQKRC